MNASMRWVTVSTAVALLVATGGATARAESNSGTTGTKGTPTTQAAGTAPKAADQGLPTSQPQHHEAKPAPTPHRKAEAGTLKISNKQARTFTLDCETCAPEAKGQIYKAPAAMNLRALDGKRVRVTFDTTGNVQSVRRIDARRHLSTGKKDA